MNIERIQLKGQLVEAKSEYKRLDVEVSGMILVIRSYLNPYEEDSTKIDVEKSDVLMERLKATVERLRELKTKIEKLEEYFA